MNVTLSIKKYNWWEWIEEEKIKIKKEYRLNEGRILK